MAEIRILIGFGLMAVVCMTAVSVGNRALRRAAILVAGCWALATLIELGFGHRTEAVIAGDSLCGLGLLFLAATETAWWVWILLLVQSALFLMHALLYKLDQPPTTLYVVANNSLNTLGLAIVFGTTLLSWLRRPTTGKR